MKARIIPVALATVAAVACSTMRTSVDWDQTIDFSRYRTFAFQKGSPARNDLQQRAIERAVAAKLQSKGLMPAADRPDLRVFTHVVLSRAQRIDTIGYGYGWRWGGGIAATTVTNIPVGTLIVDLVDTERKELVWRGKATDTIESDREERREQLREAIDKIFANFPPAPSAR
jgi:hypothetical protein